MQNIIKDSENKHLYLYIILVAVLSLWFRISYVQQTIIYNPVMGDAGSYVQYANNLINYTTFSKSSGTSAPKPDSYWAPGYPAFLAVLITIGNKIGINPYLVIMYTQVALGAFISILTLLLGRQFLSNTWSLLPALLVSFSPHMISMGGYLLTETLFSFLLLAALYTFSIAFSRLNWYYFSISGLFFGLSYLTNPVMFFTPILLVLVIGSVRSQNNTKLALSFKLQLLCCLFIFSVIVGSWSIRNMINVEPGQSSGKNRLFTNLIIGTHSNFYDVWRADTRDPENPATKDGEILQGSYSAFIKLLMHRVIEDPGHYAKWYFVNKPILLWSWNILIGKGDIYVYPPKVSFYDNSIVAITTHFTMKLIHYWLFGFALLGIFFLFPNDKKNRQTPLFIYITTIYISAVYVVTQSEPRYSIPLRPEMYLCSVFFLSKISDYLKLQTIKGN